MNTFPSSSQQSQPSLATRFAGSTRVLRSDEPLTEDQMRGVILTSDAVAGPELAEAIFAFSRRQLAPYKRVRRIEFVTELPRTISGKIRRVQLRAQEVERRAANRREPGEYFEKDFPQLKTLPEG